MINVYFNSEGYFIEKLNVATKYKPALNLGGDRIFQDIHHQYAILFHCLRELKNIKISEDICIYNDTRIIDEINGNVDPLDETCKTWNTIIRQNIIPNIRSLIFFRKKQVKDIIKNEHSNMFTELKPVYTTDNIISRKKRQVQKMKERWFNAK